MKEQIEEMARDLENHTCMSQFQAEIASRMLYQLGYRKQSEGEWIITNNRNLEIIRECSHCHAKTYYPIALRFNCRLTRYCEDCGAKMKEATDEKAET